MNGTQELGTGNPVDRRVMDLEVHREGAGGDVIDAVEALDDGDLPQWTGPIQHPRVETRGESTQLRPAARTGQCHMADVVLKVEVGILDPVGEVEAELCLA